MLANICGRHEMHPLPLLALYKDPNALAILPRESLVGDFASLLNAAEILLSLPCKGFPRKFAQFAIIRLQS